MDYGTGAIFGCPAHDQRDFDFAEKYKLEIIKVVSDNKEKQLEEALGNGKIINSNFLNGLNIEEAKEKIINEVEKNNLGKRKTLLDLKIGVFQDRGIGVAQYR